jgi:ring-1,2-phenylacetyl-CoA epoxidase subunit PaaC
MEPLKTLILAIADDELVMGHRASEWTGLGPILEADLALSSIAQDEMGHALLFYELLGELGEPDPDSLVFERGPSEYRNAILCELERVDWADTLVRHFLYDLAEQVRLEALASSTYEPLAAVAQKIRSEEKYHLLHGQTWVRKLGVGTGDSQGRIREALNRLLPYAAGLWEPLAGEEGLVADGVMPPSAEMMARWHTSVRNSLDGVLEIMDLEWIEPVEGGRRGRHTDDLTQLLAAMQLLHQQIPQARW